MKKQDNPVFIFGVVMALVFATIAVWIFFPGCNKAMGSVPVIIQSKHSPDNSPNFLVLSDIHLHSSLLQADIPSGSADTGHDLWDTAQNKIKRLLAGKEGFATPKFIIVLGDLPWHARAAIQNEVESAQSNSGEVLRALRMLAQGAHIPLIYVAGNNDSGEGDYHPFSTKIFNLDTACKTWPLIHPSPLDPGVAEASIADVAELPLGCYSAYPLGKKAGLRVIALNTTIFSHKYTAAKAQQTTEASNVIAWLRRQLELAKKDNEKVTIAMHMPPGLDGYKKKDFWHKTVINNDSLVQNAFLDLIDQYQNQVVCLLSSHTHMDGIRELYNRSGRLIAVDVSVPAITPGHGNNPGIKIISYNPANFQLQNFTTLYMPFFPNKKVVSWGSDEFDFRTEFGCPLGTSIRSCLDTLKTETLQKTVQSIYKVKNGLGNADEVNSAIGVRYE